MTISRRDLLKYGTRGGAVVLASGAVWGRMALGRHELTSRLMEKTAPLRDNCKDSDLERLPGFARQEMEDWFQTPCRNSAPFVDRLCSESFAQRLASYSSDTDREQEICNAFVSDLVQEHLIRQQVERIAKHVGNELAIGWTKCCGEIQEAWAVELPKAIRSGHQLNLQSTVTPFIDEQLAEAVSRAKSAGQRPALADTALKTIQIEAAVLMLVPISAQVAIPLALAVACFGAFRFVLGMLSQRPSDYRKSISTCLTKLAIDMGRAMETEISQQILVLHQWRESALATVAKNYAKKQVTLLS